MFGRKLIFVLSCTFILFSCGISEKKPNVLLVLIDTLRADHLGCYGYHRDTSPVIDSLASAGITFRRVQAQNSWTLPAMSSIMTGLTHRMHQAGFWGKNMCGIDPSLPHLPQELSEAGYETGAFFNVVFMSEAFGFHRGFEHFDCNSSVGKTLSRDAATTVDEAIAWLENRDEPSQPFFLAVHFYDPHLTYDPPYPFNALYADTTYTGFFNNEWGGRNDVADVNRGRVGIDSTDVEHLVNLYDGEIAFTDHSLGRLFDYLRSSGISENTLVVLAADHGEEFFEHEGLSHGHTLYQEVLYVPLIIAGPGIPSGRQDTILVGQIDVFPTIMAYCGLRAPDVIEGHNVLAELPADRELPSSLILSSGPRVTVRRHDRKVHWIQKSDAAFMFDLASDPLEQEQLDYVDTTLVEAVKWHWSTPPIGHPDPVSLDEPGVRALRDLGYL
ncbi:sulfatase-like hydrolase/transferase [Candidatus Fermentibacteria bacterium]|nr:sulfatase-like hydrolase/transferase [Candidatus Fermentibacteria bacterium]